MLVFGIILSIIVTIAEILFSHYCIKIQNHSKGSSLVSIIFSRRVEELTIFEATKRVIVDVKIKDGDDIDLNTKRSDKEMNTKMAKQTNHICK